MKGIIEDTPSNTCTALDEPIMMVMGACAIFSYSAITCLHAPQGYVMVGSILPEGSTAVRAIASIFASGCRVWAENIAVLSAHKPDGYAAFS